MRVLVGMSGGVDSSVVAYLLKEKGYEVVGITFKMLDDAYTDASLVCKNLGIEFHLVDIKDVFKKEIIDNFIDNYKKGLTPNPCVLCNKNIKFKYLNEYRIKYNCDYIATGHYSKIDNNKIYKSVDLNKDQSYFLCKIDKDILPYIIFPLDGLTKEDVRNIALKNNLITAEKKDSYDVCFTKDDINDFLNKNIKEEKGKILDIETNKELGTHNGLSHYTIGQRRGLNIGGNTSRLYVVDKDIDKNILYVSLNDKYLKSNKCIITDVNLFTDEIITECNAKFRYRQKDNKVKVKYLENNELELIYDDVISVTKGQTCSLYKDDELLGGGIIKEINQ